MVCKDAKYVSAYLVKELRLGNEEGHHKNAASQQQACPRLRLWHGADREFARLPKQNISGSAKMLHTIIRHTKQRGLADRVGANRRKLFAEDK